MVYSDVTAWMSLSGSLEYVEQTDTQGRFVLKADALLLSPLVPFCGTLAKYKYHYPSFIRLSIFNKQKLLCAP